MLEMKCPVCGGTMKLEEGRLLRACPYCGAALSHENVARGWEIPGPSELEKSWRRKTTRRRSISSFSPRWKKTRTISARTARFCIMGGCTKG